MNPPAANAYKSRSSSSKFGESRQGCRCRCRCRDSLNLELWSLSLELLGAPELTKDRKTLQFQTLMKERGVLHGVKMLARLCQANASAITSSVTELMKSGAKVSRSAIALFRLPRRAEAVTRAALRPCDGTIIGQIHGTPAQQRRTQKQDEDDVLHCVVRGGVHPERPCVAPWPSHRTGIRTVSPIPNRSVVDQLRHSRLIPAAGALAVAGR